MDGKYEVDKNTKPVADDSENLISHYAPLRPLEETRMLDIISYVGGHPECSKKQIYDALGYNARMPVKIDSLVVLGLLESVTKYGRLYYRVSPKGSKIAMLVDEMLIIIRD